MNVDPKAYNEHNYIPRNDSKVLLEAIANDFKSKTVDCVIDVGCGTGNVTKEIFNVTKCKQLIAFDQSVTQIAYAKQHNENDAIKFKVGNIADDWSKLQSDIDFERKADIVISNQCFYWVEDKRKALENVFDMLKPGGKCYILALHECKTLKYEDYVIHSPKWKQYFQHVFDLKAKLIESKAEKFPGKKALSHFGIFFREDEKEWRKMCESIGFENIRLSIVNSSPTLRLDQAHQNLAYICQWIHSVPDPLKNEFLDDFLNTFGEPGGDRFTFNYDNIVLFAERPI